MECEFNPLLVIEKIIKNRLLDSIPIFFLFLHSYDATIVEKKKWSAGNEFLFQY